MEEHQKLLKNITKLNSLQIAKNNVYLNYQTMNKRNNSMNINNESKEMAEMAQYRTDHHKVTTGKARHGDYPNECLLQVSHNGYQWQSVSLSEQEAKEVINELSNFFHFGIVAPGIPFIFASHE